MTMRHQASLLILILSLLVTGCGQAGPTSAPVTRNDTPVPPTSTPIPETPIPSTATRLPPTPTAIPPTETAVPPADTATPLPTATAIPPTETALAPPSRPIPVDTRTRSADGMVMVYLPGGTFDMGSTDEEIQDSLVRCREAYRYCNLSFYGQEAPQHPVTLDGYWFDQTEVTNAQYRQCVEAEACQAPAPCTQGDLMWEDPAVAQHPVVCVNWDEAQAYCAWVGARLPTEAQWEYAARGQEGYRYPWGNEPGGAWQNYCDASCTEGWADEAVDDGYSKTSPVDAYPEGASWCGALDLAGNVYEWVEDWSADYATAPRTNPTGPSSGWERVLRGSSWLSFWDRARGATRDSVAPENSANHIGFRCALPAGD